MMNFRSLLIAGSVAFCSVMPAQAQTFDPSDPYRLVFLDQLSAMIDSAQRVSNEWAKLRAKGQSAETLDLSELRRLNLQLEQERRSCGTNVRNGFQQIALDLMQASFDRPDRMRQLGLMVQMFEAAYRTDIETIERIAAQLDPDYLGLDDYNGDGVLVTGERLPANLMDVGAQFLSREGFYRSILTIADPLYQREALSERWVTAFYPRAMFFMGEIDALRAYSNDNDINLLDDWLVTTALRAGDDAGALAIQERIDAEDPDNLSRILFFETPAARAAHCGNMLQRLRDEEVDQEQREADGNISWFNSWRLLLCGEFADSRRAALKATWANRQGNCSAQQTNVHLVDQYNAILAGVYQAADLRESGARERATELLDSVAEEVRQALFLDSFTGYSNLEIVIEDDIAIYMDRLHGDRPELSLVKGMLERGRGNLAIARGDFEKALQLSGVGPEDAIEAGMSQAEGLDVQWLLQLTEWIEELNSALSE